MNVGAQNALSIVKFEADSFFIVGRPLFSPDASHIALQAKNKPNLYTNKVHLWLGKSEGDFKKIYEQSISKINLINYHEIAFLDAQAAIYQFWLSDAPKPMISIKAIGIHNMEIRELYKREIKAIPGSGGQLETINVIQKI